MLFGCGKGWMCVREEGGGRGCPISWEADLPPGNGDESTTEDKEHVRRGPAPLLSRSIVAFKEPSSGV